MLYQQLMLAEPARPSLTALVVLATHRFVLVLTVKPLVGPLLRRLHHPWRVMTARTLRLPMQIQV